MKKWIPVVMVLSLITVAFSVKAAEKESEKSNKKKVAKVLDRKMKSLSGKTIDLSKYKGKVLLIVNTASECGLTKQYKGLQALHEDYNKQGLAVLGFPCNQFGGQEPGSAKEISTFCTKNYGVKFDMFAKIEVNGENRNDLYKYLTTRKTKPAGSGDISWNFEKFLVSQEGKVIARYSPKTEPQAKEIVTAIKAELAKKKK